MRIPAHAIDYSLYQGWFGRPEAVFQQYGIVAAEIAAKVCSGLCRRFSSTDIRNTADSAESLFRAGSIGTYRP